jgi:excinuclease UvrABC helicase subunit UvrB
MKFVGMSLTEVAAAVATHLKTHDIEVVVVGGSAITSHAPDVYTSMDIDLAVTSGIDRRKIGRALGEIGFQQRGRVFVHPDTRYELDIVADRPYIEQQPIFEFTEIKTPAGGVRARDHLTWEATDLALRKVDTRLAESATPDQDPKSLTSLPRGNPSKIWSRRSDLNR